MGTAGDYKKTVTLREFSGGTANSLGHTTRTYFDVRKCAARLWQSSAAERSQDPAEFAASDLRLLLYLPPSDTEVGWHVVYGDNTYEIVSQEWRDDETTLLITLAKQ